MSFLLVFLFQTKEGWSHPNASQEMKIAAHSALKMTLPPLLEFAQNYPNEFKFINQVVEQLNTYDQLGHSLH